MDEQQTLVKERSAESAIRADRLEAAWRLARREFGQEFPTTTIWYGLVSGMWRAMVPGPGGWRMLESPEPENLRMQIRGALGVWPAYGAQRCG
ncbi:MAG TPA: hypothetical protein VHJ17_03685 [Thermomonospora sp.]|nr:hypothetical protein [Thermomonospora sp.]